MAADNVATRSQDISWYEIELRITEYSVQHQKG